MNRSSIKDRSLSDLVSTEMKDKEAKVKSDFVDVNQASKMIGVSTATIRNWIKTGVIIDITSTSGKISLEEIDSLIVKIENGDVNRLKQRANKSTSSKTIVPNEYILQDSITVIRSIVSMCKDHQLTLDDSIFYAATAFLFDCGEIQRDEHSMVDRCLFKYRRKGIEKIILDWKDKLRIEMSYSIIESMSLAYNDLNAPKQQDLLGAIYQVLSSEGSKSEKGSYYTPMSIVSDMITSHYQVGMKFLDPCCGTGQFLLSCANQNGCKYSDLYGIDIDPIGVYIASINLLLAYPNDDFVPNIYNCNALTDIDFDSLLNDFKWLQNRFNFIATNPPWGAALNKKELTRLYPEVKSGESYSYFITKCYDFLQDNGILSLILPESVLNISVHRDIRQFILKNFTILSITELGRAFSSVFTKVCRIDMMLAIPENDHSVIIGNQENGHRQRQSLYSDKCDFSFSILHQDGSRELLDKFFSREYITLKGNADWALGIVTGNNHKFLSDNLKKGFEPIYRGKDILPMRLDSPQKFIHFTPDLFQQVAPEWKYRVDEKLVYRFISRRLVFAYDNRKVLTLNSANICIPRISCIDMRTIAAILNSKTYNYIFIMLFNTHKVLRSNLEELPIPIEFMDANSDVKTVSDTVGVDYGASSILDDYLMDFFNLNNKEKETVRNTK